MSTGTVDLTPLIQIVLPALGTLMTALLGYATFVLKQRANIQQNSADAALIDMAAQRAGGLAYSFLAKEATGLPHSIDMRNAAVASGVNHMIAGLPDALARQGVTQDTLARMVNGELGKLEATDPNVSIGPVAATAGVSGLLQPAPATDQVLLKPAASTTIEVRGAGAGGVGGNLPPSPPASAQ